MGRIQQIQMRRGTAAAWTLANPTLGAGEPGWESDTDRFKIGDGTTAWTSLPYFNQSNGTRKIVSGRYYGALGGVPGTTAQGTNVLTVVPRFFASPITVAAISCEVTATAASSTVRLGVYSADATTDMPSTVLLDAGTVDSSTTTGVKEITGLSTVLAPGLYWLSAVPQGGNPTLRTIGNSANEWVQPNAFIGSVATGGMNCYFWTGVSGALATWAGSNTGGTGGTKVMVKAA